MRRDTEDTLVITSKEWMKPEKKTAAMKSSGRSSNPPFASIVRSTHPFKDDDDDMPVSASAASSSAAAGLEGGLDAEEEEEEDPPKRLLRRLPSPRPGIKGSEFALGRSRGERERVCGGGEV